MQLRRIRYIQRGYQTEERALVVTVSRDHWDVRDSILQNEVLRGACKEDAIHARWGMLSVLYGQTPTYNTYEAKRERGLDEKGYSAMSSDGN